MVDGNGSAWPLRRCTASPPAKVLKKCQWHLKKEAENRIVLMLQLSKKAMKSFSKILIAGLFSAAMLTATAQEAAEGQQHDAAAESPHAGCPMHSLSQPIDIVSVKTCYVPDLGAFIAIDSAECAVHKVSIGRDGMDTTAVFVTDYTKKRHDLKNILRPVSVSAMGPYVLVLASAVNDSAYVAILDSNFNVLARRGFNSPMYAMSRQGGSLIVVGRNTYGYDIDVLPLHRLNFEQFEKGDALTHHYRVAKQSEKIKQSDPIGIGLTAVAVSVVFLALVCIACIIAFSGKVMQDSDKKRKEGKKSDKAIKPVSSGSSAEAEQEVYAAIAAAIHLYNDELHDEEDTVITIQKVEREWTPWNAKYYNMNHYFNNRK